MSCNNCYNGCVETTSDKCVRYTGNNIEELSIENGDSLFVVEQALIDAVVSFLDGTGIDITIDPAAYCALVVDFLPTCKPICSPPTVVELFEALVKAACSLQTQVTAIDATLTTLNADYTIDCLDGVTASSDTHAIVQATINKVCELGVDLAALALDVDTNYVKISDVDTYIAAYLAGIAPNTNNYTKMVPYIAYEYYGSLTGFNSSGVGSGVWTKVYLCNGLNGTPDKRGRVAVGAIVNMGTNTLNAAVDPVIDPIYNPNYTVNQILGSNSVTLLSTQIPVHTHVATVTDDHFHYQYTSAVSTTDIAVSSSSQVARALNLSPSSNLEYNMNASPFPSTLGKSGGTQGTISVSNANAGSGAAHDNKQPVIAAYYIMYIP
jgi:microcystin-dependent protein